MTEVSTLADALPAEINRVRELQGQYKELRQFPNVIVEPQIAMMGVAIQEGTAASISGDVVEMLRAHANLKDWEQ